MLNHAEPGYILFENMVGLDQLASEKSADQDLSDGKIHAYVILKVKI